jgi:hypothetical protein
VEFAIRHRFAVDDIAGNKAAGLCRYKLSDEEWKIAERLCDTLKVTSIQLVGGHGAGG